MNKWYTDFLFLPPHCPYDCAVDLLKPDPGPIPPPSCVVGGRNLAGEREGGARCLMWEECCQIPWLSRTLPVPMPCSGGICPGWRATQVLTAPLIFVATGAHGGRPALLFCALPSKCKSRQSGTVPDRPTLLPQSMEHPPSRSSESWTSAGGAMVGSI